MTDVAVGTQASGDEGGAAVPGTPEGAPAAGGAAPAQQPTAPETGGAAPGSPDFGQLFQQFENRIGTQLGEFEKRLPPAPEEPAEPDPDDPESFFSEADFDDQGAVTDEAAERHFMAMVRKTAIGEAQRIAREMVEPLRAERLEERRGQQADALEQKYPELAEEAMQVKVLDAAGQYAQSLGVPPDAVDAVATDPAFIEIVFLALKAQEASDGESGAPTPGVPLETGTGAAPAAAADEPDIGKRLVEKATHGRFRLGQ